MTFHFKLPNMDQLTASPEHVLGEEKAKFPLLNFLIRDSKREASLLFLFLFQKGRRPLCFPRSYWLSFFAIIGLTIWCESPCAQGVPTPGPPPKEQTEKASDTSAQHPSNITVTIFETLEQAKAREATESKSQNHDEKDLQAQIKAADASERGATAAEWQIVPTWLGAIFSFVSALLLIYSITLNRKATNAAIKMVETDRAWMVLDSITCDGKINLTTSRYHFKITWINSGKSPAVKIYITNASTTVLNDFLAANPCKDTVGTNIKLPHRHPMYAIGAGASASDHDLTFTEDEINRASRRDCTLYIYSGIIYDTVYPALKDRCTEIGVCVNPIWSHDGILSFEFSAFGNRTATT
jgi:hypothetical protein